MTAQHSPVANDGGAVLTYQPFFGLGVEYLECRGKARHSTRLPSTEAFFNVTFYGPTAIATRPEAKAPTATNPTAGNSPE
jgi:hypothetical protein